MKIYKNRVKSTTMIGLTALAITSCASSNKAQKDNVVVKPDNIQNMEDMDNSYLILSDAQLSAVNKGNTFALNLFRTQAGMDSKVVSPLSVAYLMGMLANGAEGNTQTEIMKTLGMNDVSLETLNEAYKAIINTASTLDKQTTVNIANCIAVNQQISIKDKYKKAMLQTYNAQVESMNFAGDALKRINNWCDKQTNGMIPSIIDQLNPNAIAVIMNAIYFNGTWDKKFDKNDTKKEPFKGYTRDIKRVDMMHQNAKFDFVEQEDFSAINLPYGNGTYNMTVILPHNGKSTTEIMEKLNAEKLSELNNKMEKCIVDLKLPRFSTSTETQLNKPISNLGAPSMFISSQADFSKISDTPMFISSMLQKAKIEVSEEGTKAAAVTAGVMMMSALPSEQPRRVEFHADHPFVYLITESHTGAIFFIGQYTGDNL